VLPLFLILVLIYLIKLEKEQKVTKTNVLLLLRQHFCAYFTLQTQPFLLVVPGGEKYRDLSCTTNKAI